MIPSQPFWRVKFRPSMYVVAAIWGVVVISWSVWSPSQADETGRVPDPVTLPERVGPMATDSKNAPLLIPPAPSSDEPRMNATGELPMSRTDQRKTPPILPEVRGGQVAGERHAADESLPFIHPENILIPPLPVTDAEAPWTIAIVPLDKPDVPLLGQHYDTIYQSIPYRRAEYLANPSYRHDATMEILFGQMRPTVIHRTDVPQRVVNPRPQLTQPYPLSKGELYSYWPLLQYGSPIPLLSPMQ